MGRVIGLKRITVEGSNSVLGFELEGWSRFLTLDTKRAYHIGGRCDTCGFLFERLDGANRSVSVEGLASDMAAGLNSLDERFMDRVSQVLLTGDYVAALLEIQPVLVAPGDTHDYFTHEQVKYWGIDGFTGLPLYPKTKYFRGSSYPLAENKEFYEFLVPMFPPNWLDEDRVTEYRQMIRAGVVPTALTVSILDVRQPWDQFMRHWCLAHYLIDGHHKVWAASLENKPLTLMAFIAVDQSMATEEELQELLRSLESQA